MLYSLPTVPNPLFGPRSFKRRNLGFLGNALTDAVTAYYANNSTARYLSNRYGPQADGTSVFYGGKTWRYYAPYSVWAVDGSDLSLFERAARPAPSTPTLYSAPVGFDRVPPSSDQFVNYGGGRISFNQQSLPGPYSSAPPNDSSGVFVDRLPLDWTKVQNSNYFLKVDDLGSFVSGANRTYISKRVQIFDELTGHVLTYYTQIEGGGSGNFFDAIAPTLTRVVTDVGTLGQSEIVHAVDSDVAAKVDTAYTAGVVGAGTAFLTGGLFAPEAVGAAFTAGAVAGEATAIPAEVMGTPKASDVLAQAAGSGAVAGVVTGLFSGGAPAPTPEAMGPVTITPETAGSTLLPPDLSLIPPTAPPPVFGLPPVPFTPLDFSGPPLDHLPLPPSPIDASGSTILPPDLSLTAPVETAANPASGSILADIASAGKVALPGALTGYQIYKKLTAPAPTVAPGGSTYVFGGDPNAGQVTPAPAPSYTMPLLAGGALLLLVSLKAKSHR